ncbi:squamosa promoter-binding-like protein 16 [Oryza brachyantha]|uniref:squamosa promoter-binding-like protein 16 n=1 Tax=Oryza brachyantha TaxID=4533 RepID=UPI001ADCB9F3|nr:squamosa promoter-binding-like protein 16 [Oryza brachyantha]
MEWDLKMPPASWELADELENGAGAAETGAAVVAGGGDGTAAAASSSSAVVPGGGGVNAGGGGGRQECSVDLKLGGLGEFGGGGGAQTRVVAGAGCGGGGSRGVEAKGKGPAAASAPAKRARASGGGGGAGQQQQQQCPSCAVDGCKEDLSKHRDYHRRHKVCEGHSKTPLVVVAGREMRFCQQCSRFHLLAEFDETKRSCRKRLDGHNRRRRKPQPDPMSNAGYIASPQGARFSPFVTPRPEASWTGMMKTEESPYYTHHHQIPLGISSSRQQHFVGSTSDGGRRFPFLQEGEISFGAGAGCVPMDAAAAASVCQPLLKTVAPPPPHHHHQQHHDGGRSSSSGASKMFSDGLTQVLDSDCALSLLSAPANSSAIDVGGRMVVQPTEHIPMAQPLISGLQFGGGGGGSVWFAQPHQAATAGGGAVVVSTAGFSCPVVESEQLNTVLSSNDNEMNYNGMFHVGGEGSSDGTSSSQPFSWQ